MTIQTASCLRYGALLLGSLYGLSNTMAATLYGELQNNYPADPASCTVGEVYDDGNPDDALAPFTYHCTEQGKLCASYCLTFSDDDNTWITLERDEIITYDQESALRCEVQDGYLYQLLEDVTTEELGSSQVPYCQ